MVGDTVETGILFEIVETDEGNALTLVLPIIGESTTEELLIILENTIGFYDYTYSTSNAISGCFEATFELF